MLSHVFAFQISAVIIIAFGLLVAYFSLHKDTGYYTISTQNKLLVHDEKSCIIGLRIFHSCDSKKWKDFCIEEAQDLFISEYYDKTKCTALIGLPFLNSMDQLSQKIVIEALVSRCNYNIILLNNSKHTFVFPWKYNEAILNSYEDAKVFAAALNQAMDTGLLRRDCVVGVGYSLAANLMGHVCRMLKYPCQVIYAIDPAGPGFSPPGPDVPAARQLVSQQDACHVVFLLCTVGILGTKYHLGHVNILLNDGVNQPNCQSNPLKRYIPWFKHHCSHNHCNTVFAYGMGSPGSCVARKCEILGKSHAKTCDGMPEYRLGLAPDRRFLKCGIRSPDLFFLETTSSDTCK